MNISRPPDISHNAAVYMTWARKGCVAICPCYFNDDVCIDLCKCLDCQNNGEDIDAEDQFYDETDENDDK